MLALFQANVEQYLSHIGLLLRPLEPTAFLARRWFAMLLLGVGLLLCFC